MMRWEAHESISFLAEHQPVALHLTRNFARPNELLHFRYGKVQILGNLIQVENTIRQLCKLPGASYQLRRSRWHDRVYNHGLLAFPCPPCQVVLFRAASCAPQYLPSSRGKLAGANGRIRTDDLIITNDLLCQLSYVGTPTIRAILWTTRLKSRT